MLHMTGHASTSTCRCFGNWEHSANCTRNTAKRVDLKDLGKVGRQKETGKNPLNNIRETICLHNIHEFLECGKFK